jgi:glutamyl-tRNA reductase
MAGVVKARRRRPLFLIDISVPRNVDPRVGEMDNVFLYDVDDLQKVASENKKARQHKADAAEKLVRGETDAFEQWRKTLVLTPTIVALRERFRAVVRAELERTVPRLGALDDAQKKSLDAMAEAMVNKLLHAPTSELKRGADGPDAAALIHAVRTLFQLPTPAPPETTAAPDVAPSDEPAARGDA